MYFFYFLNVTAGTCAVSPTACLTFWVELPLIVTPRVLYLGLVKAAEDFNPLLFCGFLWNVKNHSPIHSRTLGLWVSILKGKWRDFLKSVHSKLWWCVTWPSSTWACVFSRKRYLQFLNKWCSLLSIDVSQVFPPKALEGKFGQMKIVGNFFLTKHGGKKSPHGTTPLLWHPHLPSLSSL